MTFDGSQWNLGREDSDMFQWFVADVNLAQGFRPRFERR